MSDIKNKTTHKGGSFAPALCVILGILILAAVILSYLPLSVPRMMGYEVYNIVSESMTPTIPMGSVIYVQAVEPTEVQEDDIIAFYRDAEVVAHRVVSNEEFNSRFVTKGDANEEIDMSAADYGSLIGRVVYHIPYLGYLMTIYTGTAGKIYALMFAACGAMLIILSGRIRSARRSKEVEEYIRSLSQKEEDE